MKIKAPWAEGETELVRHGLRAELEAPDLEVREASPDDAGDDSVEFEGYAMKWNEEAEIGFFFRFTERFRKGAFARTIRERGPEGNGQIKFKVRHNGARENGAKFLDLREDSVGLRFKAKTIPTDAGRNLAVELREGTIDTLSIGFDAIREEVDKDQDPVLRTVVEARLFEISAVDWPAYEGAQVDQIREQQLNSFFEELEAELTEGKVLSDTNRTRLSQARDRIQAVLDSAGDSDSESDPESASAEDRSAKDATPEDRSDSATPTEEDQGIFYIEDAEDDLDLEFALREREMMLGH